MPSSSDTWEKLKSDFGFFVNIISAIGFIVTGALSLKGLIDIRFALYSFAVALLSVLVTLEIRMRLLQSSTKTAYREIGIFESSRSKHDALEKKYHLHFNDWRSVIDLAPEDVDATKLRLMKGVQDKVYAIHRIEEFLPLPGETTDDKNYFKENVEALDRIRNKHHEPHKRDDYTIHRIFILSKEALKDSIRGQAIKDKIQMHCDKGFDVRVAFTEDLKTVPPWEFAIYDEEVALRLGFDKESKVYGDGSVYSDSFQVHDRFPKLYEAIKAQSSKADGDFWKEHLE